MASSKRHQPSFQPMLREKHAECEKLKMKNRKLKEENDRLIDDFNDLLDYYNVLQAEKTKMQKIIMKQRRVILHVQRVNCDMERQEDISRRHFHGPCPNHGSRIRALKTYLSEKMRAIRDLAQFAA